MEPVVASPPLAPDGAQNPASLSGALTGVDAQGLGGWVTGGGATPTEVVLMHGDRRLLTTLAQTAAPEGDGAQAAARLRFTFELDALAAAAQATGLGEHRASFRAVAGGVDLTGATTPLCADDLRLAGVIAGAEAP